MRNQNIMLILSVTSLLLASSCAVVLNEETKISEQQKAQINQITDSIKDETLLGYVKKLSSDNYAGRLTGLPEYKTCAKWLASHFKKMGISPAAHNNSYLQSYPNPYTIVFVGGELSYNYKSKGRSKKRKYIYEKEYYPGSQSANGDLTAEVVYVGYGITAPEMNYDDYATVNVKRKIVLVEPGVPVDPKENPEAYKEWQAYSSFRYKVKMAVAHGAKGMFCNELRVNPNIDYIENFMVAQVGDTVVKDIFARTGKTHKDTKEKIKNTLKPQSFRTRKVFTIENFTRHFSKATGYNVIGQIEGTDPLLKNEVIILGAHLDNVGFCYETMPGANNNASGVAVMMGVAEALSKSPIKPKRSVLFIGLGSSEQGFKGAQTYLDKPTFPKKKTVVFLNLDMVGCGDKLQALAALNYPSLWEFILKANNKSVRRPIEPLPYSNLGIPQLDATLFINKHIPSISFSAYGTPTYPRTTKDTIKTITPGIMEDLAKILYQAVLNIANTSQDFFDQKKGK